MCVNEKIKMEKELIEITNLYVAGWLIRCGHKPVDLKPNKEKHGDVVFCFEKTDKLLTDRERYGKDLIP